MPRCLIYASLTLLMFLLSFLYQDFQIFSNISKCFHKFSNISKSFHIFPNISKCFQIYADMGCVPLILCLSIFSTVCCVIERLWYCSVATFPIIKFGRRRKPGLQLTSCYTTLLFANTWQIQIQIQDKYRKPGIQLTSRYTALLFENTCQIQIQIQDKYWKPARTPTYLALYNPSVCKYRETRNTARATQNQKYHELAQ